MSGDGHQTSTKRKHTLIVCLIGQPFFFQSLRFFYGALFRQAPLKFFQIVTKYELFMLWNFIVSKEQ